MKLKQQGSKLFKKARILQEGRVFCCHIGITTRPAPRGSVKVSVKGDHERARWSVVCHCHVRLG